MRVALVCSLLVACAEHPTYYGEVKPILDARCIGCHQDGGIAPFELTTFESARANATALSAAVASRTMPPWLAATTDVTYRHDPSLTDAQIATLKAWVKDGTPMGDSKARPAHIAGVGGGLERVDVELAMPEPYLPIATPDEYRCFPIKWQDTQRRYVTGFNALPGNARIVHHAAIYVIPPEYAHLPIEWDGEEAGPGYSCYGAPYGDRPQSFPIQLLAAWIPGYQGVTFPEGLGIAVEPDAMLVLQMHYNQADADPARHETVETTVADQTRVLFSVADSVEKQAVYAPFLNIAWVAGSMQIPAHTAGVKHAHRADPRSFFDLFGVPLDVSNGFSIWAAMFHMHQLGREGNVFVHKARGKKTEILHIPRWDFHWQQEYYFSEPVRFDSSDELELQCIFDNDRAEDVNWGESSQEEMCVVNLLITE